jgi:glycosyltransferase involved in cell wall biosynthesis
VSPRLAIVGSYPPPYGGVANHVQRLCALLDGRDLSYRVYNAVSESAAPPVVVTVARRRRRWLVRFAATAPEPVIYVLSDRLGVWLLAAGMARWRHKRVLVRLRNAALTTWLERSPWRARLAGTALRSIDTVVCVSARLAAAARSLGVSPERVLVAPGFLPPRHDPADRSLVDPLVWRFIDGRRPLIAANGRVAWHDGVDLYGLDMLVDLAARLLPDHPDLGVVVCFWDYGATDAKALGELRRRADALGVADRVLFNTASGAFVPVLAAADVFVRPTHTDGDASSLREALYLGVPAVASDVVERPAGTHVFATRDLAGLEAQVRLALQAPRRPVAPLLAADDEQRIRTYVDLLTR